MGKLCKQRPQESGGASSPRRFCHGLCGKNHEPHSQGLRKVEQFSPDGKFAEKAAKWNYRTHPNYFANLRGDIMKTHLQSGKRKFM